MKTCGKCGITKAPADFYVDKTRALGLSSRCRECHRAHVKAYRKTERGKEVSQRSRSTEAAKASARARRSSPEYRQQRAARRKDPEFHARELAYSRGYEARPEVVARRADYAQYEARQVSLSRYGRSTKCRVRSRAYRQANIEQAKAREALNRAVRDGRVTKGACAKAGENCRGRVEAHHHRGYDPAHWLDVVWLCKRHHVDEHDSQVENATCSTNQSNGNDPPGS